MMSATKPQRRITAICMATSLCSMTIAVSAADTAASAVPPSASQRLQQRFTAAAEGWRKAAAKLPDQKEHEAEVVRDLRVAVAPTPVPLLRVYRRLDGHTLIVSAGWLALLDELLRAGVVSEGASGPDKDCLRGYGGTVKGIIQGNLKRAAEQPPQSPRAWPRLTAMVEAGEAPFGCKNVSLARLRSPAVQSRVDKGADGAALWLLTRQAALLVALRVPVPAAKAAASVPAGGLSVASPWTCATHGAQPVAAASAASMLAAGTIAAPAAAASSPDERAQQALDCYDLPLPTTLSWLLENASELFDEHTVQALIALKL